MSTGKEETTNTCNEADSDCFIPEGVEGCLSFSLDWTLISGQCNFAALIPPVLLKTRQETGAKLQQQKGLGEEQRRLEMGKKDK
jgi:hypothetical protein